MYQNIRSRSATSLITSFTLCALALLLCFSSAHAVSVDTESVTDKKTGTWWEFIWDDIAAVVEMGDVLWVAPPSRLADLEAASGGVGSTMTLSAAVSGMSSSVVVIRFEGGGPNVYTGNQILLAGFPYSSSVTPSTGFMGAVEYSK